MFKCFQFENFIFNYKNYANVNFGNIFFKIVEFKRTFEEICLIRIVILNLPFGKLNEYIKIKYYSIFENLLTNNQKNVYQ